MGQKTFLHGAQTGFEIYRASYPVGTGETFPGGRAVGPLISVEEWWNYTSTQARGLRHELSSPNSGIVGSNSIRGMDVCVYVAAFFFGGVGLKPPLGPFFRSPGSGSLGLFVQVP
jgi:hypothetical protein